MSFFGAACFIHDHVMFVSFQRVLCGQCLSPVSKSCCGGAVVPKPHGGQLFAVFSFALHESDALPGLHDDQQLSIKAALKLTMPMIQNCAYKLKSMVQVSSILWFPKVAFSLCKVFHERGNLICRMAFYTAQQVSFAVMCM